MLSEVFFQGGKTLIVVEVGGSGSVDQCIGEAFADNVFGIDERLQAFCCVPLALDDMGRFPNDVRTNNLDVRVFKTTL